MAGAKPLRFPYEPETTIHETEKMVPLDEYAHRRLTDLILLCRNQLPDNDADLARMTRTGADWPAVKARLIDEHGAFYVSEDGYLRNGRCDEILAGVERSIEQKRLAGRASAEKRQARKDAALPQPPAPAETAPRQVLPEPPTTDVVPPSPEPPAIGVEVAPSDDPAQEPEPIVVEPVPMNGNGAGDGSGEPEREGTAIPQDWQPNTEGTAFAQARGFAEQQIEALVVGFVTNCREKSITSKNFNATFRLWVLRAVNSSPRPGVGQPMTTAL